MDHDLPQQLTAFVGRKAELAHLERLTEERRLVTLTGAGGCGKTRLAVEVCGRHDERTAASVCFVDLGSLGDPSLLPQAVSSALGVPLEPRDDQVEALAAAIGDRDLLLCLDTCEHVLPAAAELTERLLRRCPRVSVLATSREPLVVTGETVWQVDRNLSFVVKGATVSLRRGALELPTLNEPQDGIGDPVLGVPKPGVERLLSRGYVGIGKSVPAHHVILPASASVPLVFKIEDSPHRPQAFTHGADTTSTLMGGACAPAYLEFALSPLGAYTVLATPLHELTGQLVDLSDLFGSEAARLTEKLRYATPWARRFQIIDEFLMHRAVEGPQAAPEVAWSWQRIQRTGGRVTICRLAEDVGWSHRHLIAMFKRQVGLPPQMVGRLARFERLRRLLDRHPAVSLARVAVDLGFADQAHLSREFKTFSGLTPTQYIAQIRPMIGPDHRSDDDSGRDEGPRLRPDGRRGWQRHEIEAPSLPSAAPSS